MSSMAVLKKATCTAGPSPKRFTTRGVRKVTMARLKSLVRADLSYPNDIEKIY